MPWRLIVDKDVVGEFSETTNYVLQEVEIMEKVVKKIRRHNIDSRSDSYFQFLESTMEQLKSMLYIPKVHKRMKEGKRRR